MSTLSKETKRILLESSLYLATTLLAMYATSRLLTTLNPSSSDLSKSRKKGKENFSRLKSLKWAGGGAGAGKVQIDWETALDGLNEYEEAMLNEVVSPGEIEVGFDAIAGLDPTISTLKETIIFPLLYPNLYSSSGSNLLQAPKGVLLYGPPGCGKTMLAKALARESGAAFINVPLSALANKWYGESNKLIAGLFTLARRLQPTIIFIDEIDSLLRNRGSDNHEVTSTIKAEFLTLWDGLTSGENTRILVLGATNRPNDIDPAFLRRMPKKFSVGLPDATQRERILTLMLSSTPTSDTLSIPHLAALTEGRSGSDLKELCREAAMRPLREELRSQSFDPSTMTSETKFSLRPLELRDFFQQGDEGDSGKVGEDELLLD